MGNTTSTSKPPKITPQDRAILNLKNQRDALHRHQSALSTESARLTTLAQQALHSTPPNRRAALLALRRKKFHESLLSKTDAQLFQLEQLVGDVEFSLVQKDVYFGLKQGQTVLKEIGREMGGVEDVEKLMGRNEDEIKFQDEVVMILTGRMTREEEEDVEQELEGLEGKKLEEPASKTQELPAAPRERIQIMPEAPGGEPKEATRTKFGDAKRYDYALA